MTLQQPTAHARMNAGGCFTYRIILNSGSCFECGKQITEHTHIFVPGKTFYGNARRELIRRPAPAAKTEVCS